MIQVIDLTLFSFLKIHNRFQSFDLDIYIQLQS